SHYSSKENIHGGQLPSHLQFRHPTFSGVSTNATTTSFFAPSPVHFADSSPSTRDSPTPKPPHLVTTATTKPPASSRPTATTVKPTSGGAFANLPEPSASRPSDDSPIPSTGTPIRKSTPPPILCLKCAKANKGRTPPLSTLQADVCAAPEMPSKQVEAEMTPPPQPPSQQVAGSTGCRQRSKSLSPVRTSSNNEQDILILNHVYRERFPKASAQMQDNLTRLCEEMEQEDTFAWTAVARFMHKQVLELARDCLEKALAGLITSRYFFELTERLEKLVVSTRAKCPSSTACVTNLCNRLLLIISRPARLLECLEFDPCEFYQMLEVAETHVRQRSESCNVFCPDVPRYIISKLGLSKPEDAESDGYADASVRSDANREGFDYIISTPPTPLIMNDFLDVSAPVTPSHGFSSPMDLGSPTTHDATGPLMPSRRPCEADFEIIKLISNGAY
uniref:DUF1908 domain-containing protein n=1 Tax=Mesocestoides corti TaxID=53468 RepID=A0A5K3FQ93_MESCO